MTALLCSSCFSYCLLKLALIIKNSLGHLNHQSCYSLSHKTLNTRENFWNVYCFTTNQMQDETAKDNGQTAAGISHNLIRNNQLALSSMTNSQFSFVSLWKCYLLPKPKTSHLIPSVQKPNYQIDLKVSANCENLQQHRFTALVKVSQLQKDADRKPQWPFTAN